MRRFLQNGSWLAALASGLLLSLSFPTPGFSLLAWFGLVPLLVSARRHLFRDGFLAGVSYFAAVLYWLNIVMTTYGGLSWPLAIAAYLLLALYLALFFGVAVWVCGRLRFNHNLSYVLTLPIVWVSLEYVRAFLLSGFPWATLGYSQQKLMLIQSADIFGVYGISFLVIFGNAVLAELFLAFRGHAGMPYRGALALAFLFLLNLAYGWHRLGQDLEGREFELDVAVIQGNVDQAVKWHPAFRGKTIANYLRLSLQAHAAGATDLIIWPEAALPFYFQNGGPLAERIRELPQKVEGYLLFGSPAFQGEGAEQTSLNSAYLLAPDGRTVGRSDKVHLVPFGEYVPLKPLLPFVDKLVVGIGDFSPGDIRPLSMAGHEIGVLVCYEAIFPKLARDFVLRGSDLLVNITNDAWFGRSSAPGQHLEMVRYRAIENRIWVARAANTGISAFVSPAGRIIAATDLFETTYATARIGLGAKPGIYAKTGDLFPKIFLFLTLFWLFYPHGKSIRQSRHKRSG